MKKCCICGRDVVSADPYVLFQSASGEDMHGCETCEKQLNILMTGENPAEVKKAVNYFYTCATETSNDEVRGFLQDIVESNAVAVDQYSIEQKKKMPIEQRQMDYFTDRDNAAKTTSGWIVLLNIFAVIGFIAIIIASLVAGIPMLAWRPGAGLGIIFGGIAGGLMVLSFYMMLIHMAKDIKAIRAKLEKMK